MMLFKTHLLHQKKNSDANIQKVIETQYLVSKHKSLDLLEL